MAEKYTAQVHPLQARRTPVPELDIRRSAMTITESAVADVSWVLQRRRSVAAFIHQYKVDKLRWMRIGQAAYVFWLEGTAP